MGCILGELVMNEIELGRTLWVKVRKRMWEGLPSWRNHLRNTVLEDFKPFRIIGVRKWRNGMKEKGNSARSRPRVSICPIKEIRFNLEGNRKPWSVLFWEVILSHFCFRCSPWCLLWDILRRPRERKRETWCIVVVACWISIKHGSRNW